jgi:hypothetical protein
MPPMPKCLNYRQREEVTTLVDSDAPFDRIYRWKNNPARARLNGRRCRILAVGKSKLSALVEFEDGERVVTSIRALRKT